MAPPPAEGTTLPAPPLSSFASPASLPTFNELGLLRQRQEPPAPPPHDLNLPVPEGESGEDTPSPAPPAAGAGKAVLGFAFDVPVVRNGTVERWIDYFTGPGRDRFGEWLRRSARFLPAFRKILKEEGLPEDLAYVPLIESGYSLRARSRAGAVGPWQFMEGTARRVGLRVDSYLDERREPLKATRAAAQYLAQLYQEFGDWHLALAAYNAGENRIRSAIRASGRKTYWELARTRHLPVETKNYVGKYLAGMMIAKNPEVFSFAGLEYESMLRFEAANLPRPVSLKTVSKLTGVSIDEIADLNPELRMGVSPPGGGFALKLPAGKAALFLQKLARAPRDVPPSPGQYRIRAGDTLSAIAQRFNVPLPRVLELNLHLDPRRLPVGALVRLPSEEGKPGEETHAAAARGETHHVVEAGESVWTISRLYGVSPEDLIRWNSLSTSAVIFPGDRLRVRR
ncbi:MAG: hypothetical protein A3J27_13085 [Candidatus Tectomicrobia bacterium RIFCSPLOWO2_12_FULL_69_37]|nr:MAG: hypothetical protein A3J27_13085 [Candidatus Tectomicrobia bacterium RIFCSPLOWO2_12_FULL_69_37]OGL64842.1 MAG: hypothetical protein A3I72_02560 [Candidatus Tectomicrobia bacterium RIFCSPLOWO2_02_FULL_70_19]